MTRTWQLDNERGSAVVDFVLTSFALLALFAAAMAIITNLYLRTVLTSAATDAARTMARGDVSGGCAADDLVAKATAVEKARQATQAILGNKLSTRVTAITEVADGFCTAVVSINTTLPTLPFLNFLTDFEATAHATLEFQK